MYNSIFVRATCFDLVGHPQALQEHRFKHCLVFMHCGISNAYKFQLQELLHFLIYVRATCFDLIGHPQVLQEHRFKRCLVFMHCGIPNAYKFQLQELLHFLICQGDMFRPNRSSSGPSRTQVQANLMH